ncbi:hypothetical protein HYC85_003719 [Camellia sinensis]|uniref:Uncharacterized protein n=1 Tax=Camellia sinensis TaxID=4442 RepID=A0A7J7HWM1_CAMSI|nr:hypothetical protein HYC85_003719 [Camellia sinensis]
MLPLIFLLDCVIIPVLLADSSCLPPPLEAGTDNPPPLPSPAHSGAPAAAHRRQFDLHQRTSIRLKSTAVKESEKGSSRSGLSSRQKAGIVVALVYGTCLVIFRCVVSCKKRKGNK